MEPFIHPILKVPVKLGRTVARRNGNSRARAQLMHKFLATLPDPPAEVDNTFGIEDWGMMLNSDLGDCTIAGPGHLVQAWTASAGKEETVPDSAIEAAYSAWDGYVPGDPSTDNGGDILTVLQDWQKQGLDGFLIDEHAEVNMTQLRWQQGLWLFGGLDAGVALPMSAQIQVGSTWDITDLSLQGSAAPGSWGLHCTAVLSGDPDGVTLITWGAKQRATWRFIMAYYDEAHAIISPDFNGPVPVDQLAADLQQVGT